MSERTVRLISGVLCSRRIMWALEIKRWMARSGGQSKACFLNTTSKASTIGRRGLSTCDTGPS